MDSKKFVIAYAVGLPLTYIIPVIGYVLHVIGSNSMWMVASFTFGVTLLFTAVHLACFALLIYAAKQRGMAMEMPWLWYLPAAACAFDFLPYLSSLLFVPTLLHVTALAIGSQQVELKVNGKQIL